MIDPLFIILATSVITALIGVAIFPYIDRIVTRKR
jgi:hypothetical protein